MQLFLFFTPGRSECYPPSFPLAVLPGQSSSMNLSSSLAWTYICMNVSVIISFPFLTPLVNSQKRGHHVKHPWKFLSGYGAVAVNIINKLVTGNRYAHQWSHVSGWGTTPQDRKTSLVHFIVRLLWKGITWNILTNDYFSEFNYLVHLSSFRIIVSHKYHMPHIDHNK